MLTMLPSGFFSSLHLAFLSPFGNVLDYALMYLRSFAYVVFSPEGLSILAAVFAVTFLSVPMFKRLLLKTYGDA